MFVGEAMGDVRWLLAASVALLTLEAGAVFNSMPMSAVPVLRF